ncbi:MAG: chorismate-binding protein [Hoylesella enoeca]|uniref:chorismate-binding protein n=1 Tax=Hoylesella enoeca TaxID=76123 RepID=UPI003FA14725
MDCFAYYRLPYSDHFTGLRQSHGEPRVLASATELGGQRGFVMAPFAVSADCPILLLVPDEVEERPVPPLDALPRTSIQLAMKGERSSYSTDFAKFHQSLCDGVFSKIVLARCVEVTPHKAIEAETLFFRACRLYPRMFVSLFSTPVCGTWLVITPEILLDGNGSQWHTMALAGTMRSAQTGLDSDDVSLAKRSDKNGGNITWSDKNIQEQRYVATYLANSLARFATDILETGPRTVHAGHLVHLRSDFHFTLSDERKIGSLIDALHPTPAVCGLPKAEARRFILAHEHTPRRYYSGFAGPFDFKGSTHLYVSLRCMQISDSRYRFYAGGGLLPESTEQQEWEETEAKMETALNVF